MDKHLIARPDHYGGEQNPFEAIKIINHYDMNFNIGSALKYLLRYNKKGTPIEDLVKARQYIEFEIRKLEQQK